MVLEGDGSRRGGSSRDTPSSSVPGAVPQICMGPVGLLYDSMRTVRSNGLGEAAAKTEQNWIELSGKLPVSQGCWTASCLRVIARCREVALGWVGEGEGGIE